MNEAALHSVERGCFMIRERKRKAEEVFVRIRLESGQLVFVNKGKDKNKSNDLSDESVVVDLIQVIDLRSSDGISLINQQLEKTQTHNKLRTSENKNVVNVQFCFTLFHGIQFKAKKLTIRTPNTSVYLDWITSLKYLLHQNLKMNFESQVERWLWKQYYENGSRVTETDKDSGPFSIDNEVLKSSGDGCVSFEMGSLQELDHLQNQDSSRKLSISSMDKLVDSKRSRQNKLYPFRRYSWCSSLTSANVASFNNLMSVDGKKCIFDVKISLKQLRIWLEQIKSSKVLTDNLKEYSSNYLPKPKYVDFNGLMKIYRELILEPEELCRSIRARLVQTRRAEEERPVPPQVQQLCLDSASSIDRAWVQSLLDYVSRSNQPASMLLPTAGDIDWLFGLDNGIWQSERTTTVYQDMDRPLSEYFISSSHNSYLTGDQVTSKSSCEAYVRCLQMGCRSLELDCWNGEKEPIIYHGNTLTSKIKLIDVIKTIKQFAWQKSSYPLILSLEDHCSVPQQIILAHFMQEIFGDDLLTAKVKQSDPSANFLPSPNQMKNKIILKHKELPIDGSTKGSIQTLSSSANSPPVSPEVLNPPNGTLHNGITSRFMHCGRMYMKDILLETWTSYCFLLGHNGKLFYTDDSSVKQPPNISIHPASTNQFTFQKTSYDERTPEADSDLGLFAPIDESEPFPPHKPTLPHVCWDDTVTYEVPPEITTRSDVPSWYFGPISREKTTKWLLRHGYLGDGTFLVRISETFKDNYSLSFYRKDRVHHVKICRYFDRFTSKIQLGFECSDVRFSTMEELVEYFQANDMLALDFSVRLRHAPPTRFQDQAWYYDNPPVNKAAAVLLLGRMPLPGSFLVRCKRTSSAGRYSPVAGDDSDFSTEHFVLSHRSRSNVISHTRIAYDGVYFTVFNQSYSDLNRLIEHFRQQQMPDSTRLLYPAGSGLINKYQQVLSKQKHGLLPASISDLTISYNGSKYPRTEYGVHTSVSQGQLQQNSFLGVNCSYNINESHPMSPITAGEDEDMGHFQLSGSSSVQLGAPYSVPGNQTMWRYPLLLELGGSESGCGCVQLACDNNSDRERWLAMLRTACDEELGEDSTTTPAKNETYSNEEIGEDSTTTPVMNGADYDEDEPDMSSRSRERQHRIAKSLSDLIVYCSSVPFRWPATEADYEVLLAQPARLMSSVGEARFLKLCVVTAPAGQGSSSAENAVSGSMERDSVQKLQRYHTQHLSRVYPKAGRLDSSNMSPLLPWLSGVQMAALNFQTPDKSMQINQAMFRDNGGCGYVLRKCGLLRDNVILQFRLTFLAARHLPRVSKGLLELEVISPNSLDADRTLIPLKSEVTVKGAEFPDIVFSVAQLDLAFVRFAYGSEDRLGQKRKLNSHQATFPVRGIRPGIRAIHLRNGFDFANELATLLFHVEIQFQIGL